MSRSNLPFKKYDSNQIMLLPPSLEELIPENHPSRVVNAIIDKIDLQLLIEEYKGGGTTAHHPKMLLKLLVYAYINNVYSSRKIEALTKEHIPAMWLTAMNTPDHNTINRFRSDRLKNVLKEVFSQVVLLLAESGHLDLKEVYTDGTKIEANANKYTFVWGNSIKTNKQKMLNQLEDLWEYSEQVAKKEEPKPDLDLSNITPELVDETLDRIETNLTDASEEKKQTATFKKKKQKVNYAKRNWSNKLKEYKQKEVILGNRNSYSKTDTDATFMRMKDDHMQNGQLKAGYNLQVSTNKQFILHYSLHQKPSDSTTFIPHFNGFKKHLKRYPSSITTDSGYGSHENYKFLEQESIEPFVKYNYFHKEQKQTKDKESNIKTVSSLYYNKQKDEYTCPIGQPMVKVGETNQSTENGYRQNKSIYEAKNCGSCPLRGSCHKAKGNRRILINHELNRLKLKAKTNLLSEEGIKHRKQRPADVEAVFGNLKQNKGFTRYSLRGLEKVEIETGLLALAHNLAKIS